MSRMIQLRGQRFGKLIAIRMVQRDLAQRFSKVEYGTWMKRMWLCRCDCGGVRTVTSQNLRRGKTRSCGCVPIKRKGNFRHGQGIRGKQSGAWKSFHAAKRRCNDVADVNYPRYGGNGVKFLFSSFERFFEELGPRPEGKTLDRIRSAGNYESGNVRWATPTEQYKNRCIKRLEEFSDRELLQEVRRRNLTAYSSAGNYEEPKGAEVTE